MKKLSYTIISKSEGEQLHEMSVLLPSIGNSRTLIPLWMSLKRYWNNNKEIESIVYLFLYTIDFFYLFV